MGVPPGGAWGGARGREAAAHTVSVDDNGTINVQQAAIITDKAESPEACHWKIYVPRELHTIRTHREDECGHMVANAMGHLSAG